MQTPFLIKNATIINEHRTFVGSVIIENEIITHIFEGANNFADCGSFIDACGLQLVPGVIDSHVHFREPGLTHKGDIFTESCAAVAGGVTSFMEMPNTRPQTITADLLEQKYDLAAEHSLANFAFYIGATNDNLLEIKKLRPNQACAVKIFMGSSTGNMLLENEKTLNAIFAEIPMLIAVHCEDEQIINKNMEFYKKKFGNNIPIEYHPRIRSAEACYRSSMRAAELADKYGSRLHILHLSTEGEMQIFDTNPLTDKKITAETCVNYLWFSDKDYQYFETKIKCNPSIKSEKDREALIKSLNINKIDTISTDHAPHLWAEKQGDCLTAASGIPSVQHSLVAMMELAKRGYFAAEKVIEKMCHAPATLFGIEKRGFIREGYFADLVLINPNSRWTVTKENILYKCGWSPFENTEFTNKVVVTFVNGHKVYENGTFDERTKGKRLIFKCL
ncbi:MAG: dihydroorotase [Prevotellaceae bacterium]|jgi:dihydroorotase|nr:dihydroorotase [Prevotellaceae bacterium]